MPVEIRDVSDGLGVLITGRGLNTEKEYVDVFTKHLTQDSPVAGKASITM